MRQRLCAERSERSRRITTLTFVGETVLLYSEVLAASDPILAGLSFITSIQARWRRELAEGCPSGRGIHCGAELVADRRLFALL